MSPERSASRDLAMVTVVCVTCACPIAPLAFALVGATSSVSSALGMVLGVPVALGLLFALVYTIAKSFTAVRRSGPGGYGVAYDVIVLGLMPLWGLLVNHSLPGSCTRSMCGSDADLSRPFAEPAVLWLLAAHAATALGYVLSRRRPERLPPFTEALVLAAMGAGALLHLALGVQIGPGFLGMGLVLFPIALPVISPWLTVGLHCDALLERLRRRGAEEVVSSSAALPTGVYRHVDLPDVPSPPRVSQAWLGRTLALSPALLGLYAALTDLTTRGAMGSMAAFTQTCDHAFSRIPLVIIPRDCHYLCTVAAQGHPWLVRPERAGVRNGVPIVVNRQLALANAFEDLLHTRWPRFGRLCRAVYDRVGLPVSRWIRWRPLADAVYVAMKPFEWGFYLALLLLDPGDPEARIDRMYRP